MGIEGSTKTLSLYLKLVALVGLALFGFGVFNIFFGYAEAIPIYLGFTLLLFVLNVLRVPLREDIHFAFSEPLYTLLAVIFSPIEQAFPVFLGTLFSELYEDLKTSKRYPWYQRFFNASNVVVSNFFASLFFHAFTKDTVNFSNFFTFLLIFLTITIFEVLNSLLTSIAIALSEKFSVLDITVSVTSIGFILPTLFNFVVSSFLVWSYINNQLIISIVSLVSFILVVTIYRKEAKLMRTKREIVNALLETIGARDEYTKKHSLRVSELAVLVAKEMNLPYQVVKNVEFAGILHDLGKINFPDKAFTQKHIDHEMWNVIRKHPEISKDILEQISDFGNITNYVKLHHERFDGSGYPTKTKGDEIPIEARILAVVDSFDAMTSHRTYRRAFPVEFAIKEIKDYSGIAYDPEVVDAFLKVIERVLEDLRVRLEEEELKYRVSVKRFQ